MGELATVPRDGNQRVAVFFEDAAPGARELTLELEGTQPVEVELIAVRTGAGVPEVARLAERLPPWVALNSNEIRIVKQLI